MHPILDRILTFNLLASTLVFYIAARLYLLPRLGALSSQSVLVPILLLHSLRHLGLMFLTRGAVYLGMPRQFANPAAIGDLVTACLALAAIESLVNRRDHALALLWVFNVFGTLDLLVAITLATIYKAPVHMGAAYWIPALWVPALLVTHYVTFIILRKHWAR